MRIRALTIAVAMSGALCAAPNQWTRVGPEGGLVSRLAADPQNSSIIYAATCGGGLYKTNDGGASWSALTGLPDIGCNPNSGTPLAILAADPQNAMFGDSGALYTTWTRVSSTDGGGILKSADGGLTCGVR